MKPMKNNQMKTLYFKSTVTVLLHLIFISFFSLSIHAQNIFDIEHSEIYADHLYQIKDFSEAADEYEILLQKAPESILYKERLLLSYKFSGQFKKGINKTEYYYGKSYDKYSFVIIENFLQLLILENKNNSCELIFSEDLNIPEQIKCEYQLANYLLTKQYDQANYIISYHDSLKFNNSVKFNNLVMIFKEAEKIDYKKPIFASVLSAVIPGSGKAYSNDFKNGALAFSIIGLYAWQSYRAFSNDGIKSFYGWVFGVLASGFYIGNIYGSYQSAKRENNYQDELINEKVKNIILMDD